MTKKKERKTLDIHVPIPGLLELEEERRRADFEEQLERGLQRENRVSEKARQREEKAKEKEELRRKRLVGQLEQRPSTLERVKGFEKGAEIAWMLDEEGGYRGASLREWTYKPVAKLRGGKPSMFRRWASLDLGQLAPDKKLPQITIEPAPGEKFRVTSSVGLAVQAYGDTKASSAGRFAELPYGSVVRVGPLLFSIVYDVQAASIREDRMTLPHIGPGLDGADRVFVSGVGPELLQRARRMARRRLLMVTLTLLLTIGIGVALYALYSPPIDARKVLVLVEGVDRGLARDIEERLGSRLSEAGFEPISLPVVPAGEDRIEVLVGAAQEQLAGSILHVNLEVVEEHPGLTPGSLLLVARATARLHSVTTDINERVHVATVSGETRESTGDRVRFLRDAGFELTRVLSHGVVAELLGSMARPGFFDRVPADVRHDVIEARRMAEDQARERTRRKQLYDESCDQVRAQLEPDRSEIPTLLAKALSGPCGAEYPIGLAPDGSYAVVQVETKEPYFTLAVPSHVRAASAPERIDVIPLDGGDRRTLATATNFFGFGAVGGGRVYVVQAFWSRFGLVEIDIATVERRVLLLIDRPEQIRGPLPSPDGAWVIVWKENESSEREHPLLVRADGGEPVALDPSIRAFSWVELEVVEEEGETAGPQLLIAATTRREVEGAQDGPEDGLDLIDPTTQRVVASLVDESIEDVEEIVGVFDGSLLFQHRTRSQPSCSLGSWRPSSENPHVLIPLPRCIRFPKMMSADDIIARSIISTADDPSAIDDEVVHVNPRTGAITPLTVNTADDRYIHTGSETTRIVFGRVLPTYYRDLPRVVTMVADLRE